MVETNLSYWGQVTDPICPFASNREQGRHGDITMLQACLDYQRLTKDYAHDAMYFVEEGILSSAKLHQRLAASYYQAMWENLSHLIHG